VPARAAGAVPIVSVGALNPNGTDALFSNEGAWVTDHELGASLLSTMPTTFSGGIQPAARTVVDGRTRETIDPDDFTGGFAVWSGTSFSAPTHAGRIAARLLADLLPKEAGPRDRAQAVERTLRALTKRTRRRR
jgi:subtilisin family serine protease